MDWQNMTFTLEELEDIYLTYLSYGVIDTPVIRKIETCYVFCTICDKLVELHESEYHFESHDD
ncbi:hypothetical protein DVA79_14115 [Acinetobacter baumannii]|nr:hypothetical protein DVA79_14115 [Acinetobacter baumannii]RCU29801.1 hypothetical protein DVA69_16915 [Acinetobacter baumannii]RCU36300.1 hypothetical protein DVA81_11735 [Acinetobacter baumannii]